MNCSRRRVVGMNYRFRVNAHADGRCFHAPLHDDIRALFTHRDSVDLLISLVADFWGQNRFLVEANFKRLKNEDLFIYLNVFILITFFRGSAVDVLKNRIVEQVQTCYLVIKPKKA